MKCEQRCMSELIGQPLKPRRILRLVRQAGDGAEFSFSKTENTSYLRPLRIRPYESDHFLPIQLSCKMTTTPSYSLC